MKELSRFGKPRVKQQRCSAALAAVLEEMEFARYNVSFPPLTDTNRKI
jgi:hypothetical protein